MFPILLVVSGASLLGCDALIPAPRAANAAAATQFECPVTEISLTKTVDQAQVWFEGGGCGKAGAFYCWNELEGGTMRFVCGPVPTRGELTAIRTASEKARCPVDALEKVSPQEDPARTDFPPDVPDSVKRHHRLAGSYTFEGCGRKVDVDCTILDQWPVAACR